MDSVGIKGSTSRRLTPEGGSQMLLAFLWCPALQKLQTLPRTPLILALKAQHGTWERAADLDLGSEHELSQVTHLILLTVYEWSNLPDFIKTTTVE